MAGLDIRVDGRSYERQGVDLALTTHLGVGTKAIDRKAASSSPEARSTAQALERLDIQEVRRAENARRIKAKTAIVLDLITRENSVFDERDVAKILHRYIDKADLFANMMARVLQDPQTLRLDRERIDFETGRREPARYTARPMIKLEAEMAARAVWLNGKSTHRVCDAMFDC